MTKFRFTHRVFYFSGGLIILGNSQFSKVVNSSTNLVQRVSSTIKAASVYGFDSIWSGNTDMHGMRIGSSSGVHCGRKGQDE